MDSGKIKILVATAIVLFVCLIVWVIRTTPKPPPQIEKLDPPAIMEYEDNVIVEEKDGVKLWEIASDKIRVNTTTQAAEFENVHGKFYQEDGKILELTANKGNYDKQTGDVHVEGDVVVLDGEGGKITGEKLDWVGEEEMIVATENVKITKNDIQAFGDRAESKDGFKHFFLKGNARVLKGVKNEENSAPNNSQ